MPKPENVLRETIHNLKRVGGLLTEVATATTTETTKTACSDATNEECGLLVFKIKLR